MTATATFTICDLPVDLIDPGTNDRVTFDVDELCTLADSILALGLLEPILVTETGDGRYRLIAGERRWRATILAGLATIRAQVTQVSREVESLMMLTENLNRADLNPIEEARSFKGRIVEFGWTVEELAERISRPAHHIHWRLDLLTLGPEAQHLVATGQLPTGKARAMRNLNPNFQLAAIRALTNNPDLSYRAFQQVCASLEAEQSEQLLFFGTEDFLKLDCYVGKAKASKPDWRTLAAELCDALQTCGGNPELVAKARATFQAAGRGR